MINADILLTEKLIKAVNESGPGQLFSVAVSGGSSPKTLFRLWREDYKKLIPWERLVFFWTDERCVPPDDAESNYGMAVKELFSYLPVKSENIYRIKGENDPVPEAARYSKLVEETVKSFDFVILGIGEDGHTASIFPGNEELLNSNKYYEVAINPYNGQKRISMTLKTILSAKHVTFYAEGSSKKAIIDKIGDENLPVTKILNRGKNMEIYFKNNQEYAFIFDMDGVIIDSIDLHYRGWKNYLLKWNIDLSRDYFLNKMFGTPGREAVRALIPGNHTDEEVLEHCENVDSEYRNLIAASPEVVPVRGFQDFIAKIKKTGFKIALATSAPKENVEVVFERFKIADFFDVVVKAGDFKHGKPDPEVYQLALKGLGIAPERAVVFEDSLAGVKSATAAGIRVIGITTSQSDETLKKTGAFCTYAGFDEIDIAKAPEFFAI